VPSRACATWRRLRFGCSASYRQSLKMAFVYLKEEKFSFQFKDIIIQIQCILYSNNLPQRTLFCEWISLAGPANYLEESAKSRDLRALVPRGSETKTRGSKKKSRGSKIKMRGSKKNAWVQKKFDLIRKYALNYILIFLKTKLIPWKNKASYLCTSCCIIGWRRLFKKD